MNTVEQHLLEGSNTHSNGADGDHRTGGEVKSRRKNSASNRIGNGRHESAVEKKLRSLEVTDEQWADIAPLIPGKRARRGRPRAGGRRTLNGILYVLQSGKAWEEVPRQYGSPATCWRRLQEWSADGTWERIWHAYLAGLDEAGRRAWADAFLAGLFVPSKRGRRSRSEDGRSPRQAQSGAEPAEA